MTYATGEHPSREILAAFADGSDSAGDLQELEQHITSCPTCTAMLSTMESESSLGRRLGTAISSTRSTLHVAIDAAAGAKVSLSFLQPSSRPGALGRIAHYDALEVLGRGGFGIVLRAFDESLERVVALKVLAPELAVNPDARQRFLREARAAAAVRHENVVQIHTVSEQPLPYFVMEYIPGETLQQRLDRTGPVGAPETQSMGRQIAAGLAAAHAQGLVHRDIKPSNILLDSTLEQRVKITDFGLARAADDASLTQSGSVAGTPLFMSPEQANGEVLDQRTDLFSLGSVLYVMLTGQPPFRAANTVAVLKRVCEETPRSIREFIPDVPIGLCELISRLHAKAPADRIQKAQEVADQLSQYPMARQPSLPTAASGNIVDGSTRGRLRLSMAAGAVVIVVGLLFAVGQFDLTNRNGSNQQKRVDLPPGEHVPKEVPSGAKVAIQTETLVAKPKAADPQSPVPSSPGMSLVFDGRTSVVHIPTLSRNDSQPATLEAWVRAEFQPAAQVIALVSGKSFLQLAKRDEYFFPIEANAPFSRAADNPRYVSDEWVHVAVVSDEREIRIYTDGKHRLRLAREAAPIQRPYSFDGFWLGASPHPANVGQNAYYFLGQLDEIRVSSTDRYRADFTPATRFTPDAETLALYHCDEGSGTELQDASGHNHLGKLTAVKWHDRSQDKKRTRTSFIQGDEKEAVGIKAGPASWRVVNQHLLGESTASGTCKLQLTQKAPARFRLRCEFRLTGTGNSGIDVEVFSKDVMTGAYHIDHADTRSGSIAQLHDWKWLAHHQEPTSAIDNWTILEVLVEDATLTSFVNGQQAATIPIPAHERAELKLELDNRQGQTNIEVRRLELQDLTK